MIVLVFLLLGSVGLWAQQGPGAEPAEPDIVLPEVILRVDDLSVEQVEAAVPGEEELLAAERQIPLPELAEPAIGEPELPGGLEAAVEETAAPGSATLAAQVVLGAGSMNHLYSLLSLNRVGGEPRFKLRFLHEMLDGIGGADAGSGHQQREDSLEAGLEARVRQLGLQVEGSLTDREYGLQGLGGVTYAAKEGRQGSAAVALDHPLGELLSFGARLESSFATELLTGSAPEQSTEVLLQPALWGELHKGSARLLLETRYVWQSLLDEPAAPPALQRFGADLRFSLGLGERYLLEAAAGWLWNSELLHLFPWRLAVSGNPTAYLSFQAAGGYRVQELSYRDLLFAYPFLRAADADLEDNHGWYADAGVGLSLKSSLSLQARVLLARNSALLVPQEAPASDGVLYTMGQEQGTQLSTDLRLRWNLGAAASLSAGLQSELVQRSDFTPLHAGVVELEAAHPQGRWGGRAALGFGVAWLRDSGAVSETPVLDLSGYYNPTEAVSIIAECKDLLYPLGGSERYQQDSWGPFEAPGLRGTLKVQINL